MSEVKERLIGAITVMDEAGAQRLWDLIERMYSERGWEAIEETEPDETDLAMIRQAQQDPDCQTYASDAELRALLQL